MSVTPEIGLQATLMIAAIVVSAELSEQEVTWDFSREACASKGGRPLGVTDESQRVIESYMSQRKLSSVWLGIHRKAVSAVDGLPYNPVHVRPSKCDRLDTRDGHTSRSSCEDAHAYMCQDQNTADCLRCGDEKICTTLQETCYLIFCEPESWFSARELCSENHGSIVGDRNIVLKVYKWTTSSKLHLDCIFVWTVTTKWFTDLNIAINFPSKDEKNPELVPYDCAVYMNSNGNYRLNVVPCRGRRPFVCKDALYQHAKTTAKTVITTSPKNMTLVEGEPVHFNCVAQAAGGYFVNVSWNWKDQPIKYDSGIMQQLPNNTLVIYTANLPQCGIEYLGIFECIATNGFTKDKAQAHLLPSNPTKISGPRVVRSSTYERLVQKEYYFSNHCVAAAGIEFTANITSMSQNNTSTGYKTELSYLWLLFMIIPVSMSLFYCCIKRNIWHAGVCQAMKKERAHPEMGLHELPFNGRQCRYDESQPLRESSDFLQANGSTTSKMKMRDSSETDRVGSLSEDKLLCLNQGSQSTTEGPPPYVGSINIKSKDGPPV